MKNYIQKAIQLIKKLDTDFQELIQAAATDRSYEQLPDLAWFGEQIKKISEQVKSTSNHNFKKKKNIDQQDTGTKEKNIINEGKSNFTQDNQSLNIILNKGNITSFPVFVREGESLVKIGLSTNSGSTYEHRAPKKTIDTIIKRILNCNNKKEVFTAELISDVCHHSDGKKVPGYQLYLCLAWLKQKGLLKQRGRKGYILKDPDTIESDIDKEWDKLENMNRI